MGRKRSTSAQNRPIRRRASQPRIVVVGSANADLVLAVAHRPAAGETIVSADVVVMPGGKGGNQAVAAAKLGGDVAFIGCVGADAPGAMLRERLVAAGVDVRGLRSIAAPSGQAVILVTPDGENSIIVSPGANAQVSTALVAEVADLWLGADVLVVQLEIPLETVEHVVPRAHARGTRVIVNAAPAAALPAAVLAASDPLVVNETEAEAALAARTGQPRPGVAAADGGPGATALDLLALGARSVVLTLGAGGAVLVERGADGAAGTPLHVPAHPVAAVDTTGAGDAFVGALAVELCAGSGLEAAVRRATQVAAFAVGRRGAQASYPTRADLVIN
ncbi:ribokinase [Pengzhenrongella sicca]|uniref:Ribokinase n=2 Tax=Pengzhenrongella sicca TaxID=2819238 RepID=A0A8A4ZKD8_9MICO|nr:ribokinase [Pengzhenrongella sicca]